MPSAKNCGSSQPRYSTAISCPVEEAQIGDKGIPRDYLYVRLGKAARVPNHNGAAAVCVLVALRHVSGTFLNL